MSEQLLVRLCPYISQYHGLTAVSAIALDIHSLNYLYELHSSRKAAGRLYQHSLLAASRDSLSEYSPL